MSLHTIAPEQLSIESLWAKIRSYYSAIKEHREYEMDYTGLNVQAQLTDNPVDIRFYVSIIDDWDGDPFIYSQGNSMREALIKVIPAIENWIDTHMVRPDEEEDDDE